MLGWRSTGPGLPKILVANGPWHSVRLKSNLFLVLYGAVFPTDLIKVVQANFDNDLPILHSSLKEVIFVILPFGVGNNAVELAPLP